MRNVLHPGKSFLNCCLTGMVLTKKHTPYLPVTVEEIVAESLLLADLGAGIIHIHARDTNGGPTWRKEVYGRIIGGIREKNPDTILCVSTSGRLWSDFDRRSEVLELDGDLRPDMASLTLGSLNFMNTASISEPQMIMDLAQKMADKGIKPELEVFDTGMLNTLSVLQKRGKLHSPFYINLIFGNIYSMQFDPQMVTYLVDNCPDDAVVALGGIGSQHFATAHNAVPLDLGVRVGLEDCCFMDPQKKEPATNKGLAEGVLSIAQTAGKGILAGGDIRTLLALSRYAP